MSMGWTEHPIFVPYEDDRLAAVQTLPESDPRALVLFLQGLGAPRSHKNRIWTRMARQLADRGIASVRMDYPEIGDSTGVLRTDSGFSPVEPALAVTRLAMEASGVGRFGVVGNCMGARTGFTIAARLESCVSLGCILLGSPKPILLGKGQTAPGRAARRAAQRTPRLRRKVRGWLHTERFMPRLRFLPEVEAAVRSSAVLFLFLGREDLGDQLRQGVSALVTEVGDGVPGRVQVRTRAIVGTSGFRIPANVQPWVIDSLVGWMDETLPARIDERAAVATPSSGPAAGSARSGS